MAVPYQFSRTARSSDGSAPSMFGSSNGGGGSLLINGPAPSSGSGEPEEYSYDETPEAMLSSIKRMLESGDKQLEQQARTSLKNNRHRFTDEMLKQYGINDDKKDDRNLFEKAAGGALGFLSTVGNVVSRPQQATVHALKSIGEPLGVLGYGLTHGEGVGNSFEVAGQTARDDFKETARSAVDISGKHDINTREMLGADKNLGGSGWFGDYVVGGADLAGQMVTDPLAFVGTAGGVEGTKAGLRAVADTLGDDVARQVEKKGARAVLSEEQLQAVRKTLADRAEEAGTGMRGRLVTKLPGVDEGAKSQGVFRRFKDNALADTAGRSGSMKGLEGTERAAERNLNFLVARGQKGLKFGGQTIASREALRSPFEKVGILGKEVSTAGHLGRGVGTLAAAADRYNEARGAGLIKDVGEGLRRDPESGRAVAAAYADMPTNTPEALRSYDSFVKETEDQWAMLTKPKDEGGLGVKVEFVDTDSVPYKSNKDMMRDIVENGRLQVNKTNDAQAHPFLSHEQNDRFRAVHDAFGHAMSGDDFSRHGEEAAWMYHGQMYSEDALPAMTTETRGQNSWLNYSDENEAARAAGGQAAFPEQKVGVLPEEARQFPVDLDAQPALAERGVPLDQMVDIRGKSKVPGASRLADFVKEAFVPRSGVTRTQGAQTSEAMSAIRETTQGAATATAKDNEARILNVLGDAMKEDKNFAQEMETIVYPAMEKMGQATEHADAPAARAAIEDAVNEVARLRSEALAAKRGAERATSTAARFGAQQRGAELAERIQQAEAKVADLTAHADTLKPTAVSGAEELAQKFEAAGRTKAAAAVRELDSIRTEDTKRLLDNGLIGEDQLHDTETYMRRLMTKQANRAISEITKDRRAGTGAFDVNELAQEMKAGGSGEARTISPNATVQEINQANPLDLEKGKTYKENPFLSVGTHTNEVSRAVAEKQYLDEVSKLRATDGKPLLTQEAIEGYTQIPTKAGTYYAPPEVAKEVQRFQALVVNDDALKSWERVNDRVMKLWKAYATVPLIGAAFHMRNMQTNLMLNWVAGMGLRDMTYYADAMRMQRKLGDVQELLGKPIEGAAGRATHSFETAAKEVGLSEQEIKRLKWAREDNVLGSSYFQNDLAGGGLTDIERKTASRTRRVASGFRPDNLDNFAIRSGRAFGGNVEDNARLAHYLWSLDKQGDRVGAAMSVKKYLFNYEDLTQFEKTKLKRVIPFYTFMRKNTALMAQSLIENPGKASRFAMTERQTQDSDNPLLAGVSIPDYVGATGQRQRKGPLSGLPITLSAESPFSAAADTIAPAVQLAAELPGGPESLRNERGAKGAALDILNLPGGPPAEFAKRVVEKATGVDTFTGAPLNDRKQSKVEGALNWLDVLAPAPSKMHTLWENMQGGKNRNKEGADTQMTRLAALIKLGTGLNATAYDERTTRSTNIGRYRDLADAIEAYNAAYPDDRVPTLTELRDRNLVPEARKKRSSSGGGGLLLGGG